MSKNYRAQIDIAFTSHNVDKAAERKIETIRDMCRALAIGIDDFCPDGREKSLALTELEQVMFWANAAIAREKRKGA